MRILVLSDTPRPPGQNKGGTLPPDTAARYTALSRRRLADLSRCDTADVPVLSVRGNCDVFSFFDAPEERFVSLGGAGIMMMHGHVYRVKSGTGPAVRHAAEAGADILLFGHTHKKYEEFIPAGARLGDVVTKKPLRLFNPGSAGGYSDASFGIIEIGEAKL